MGSHTRAAVLLVSTLAACAPRQPAPIEPPPAPVSSPDGLHVWLTWAAPVDLDLYLTDPTWESLYFSNNPTRSGARLERDARCPATPASAPALEHARIAEPAAGPYRVGVDFIDACGTALEAVPFRVAVDLNGARREATGVVKREQFQVVVLEFELQRDARGAIVLAPALPAGSTP